jgi:hypothetical protein
LFGRLALEGNGASICDAGLLTVYRLGNAKSAAVLPVEEPGVARARLIAQWFARSERAEHSVVEPLRSLDIVGTNHYVIEHALSCSA